MAIQEIHQEIINNCSLCKKQLDLDGLCRQCLNKLAEERQDYENKIKQLKEQLKNRGNFFTRRFKNKPKTKEKLIYIDYPSIYPNADQGDYTDEVFTDSLRLARIEEINRVVERRTILKQELDTKRDMMICYYLGFKGSTPELTIQQYKMFFKTKKRNLRKLIKLLFYAFGAFYLAVVVYFLKIIGDGL